MKFIKHKNMKDVCFQVFEEMTRLPWQNQKVKGCWVNVAMGNPFAITNLDTIEIKDPENWREYNDARSAKASS